ncbi:MAG: hypothetical protein ACI9VM_000018 [Candidatus Azotimanducaceae bacterium]|jgi:hypothetical protein
MSDREKLRVGQSFGHGKFFELDVKQLSDGMYPYVRTGPATMTLPWRYTVAGPIEVCLLVQIRAGTGGSEIVKVSGGYDGDRTRDVAALAHTKAKLGLASDEHEMLWWRMCLGCGPQYKFPIVYGFLQNPKSIGEPTTKDCSARCMPLQEACKLATSRDSPFFDDFSAAHLLTLLMHHSEIAA